MNCGVDGGLHLAGIHRGLASERAPDLNDRRIFPRREADFLQGVASDDSLEEPKLLMPTAPPRSSEAVLISGRLTSHQSSATVPPATKTTSAPARCALTTSGPGLIVIAVSPDSKAINAVGDEVKKTVSTSRPFLRNMPASLAIHNGK